MKEIDVINYCRCRKINTNLDSSLLSGGMDDSKTVYTGSPPGWEIAKKSGIL